MKQTLADFETSNVLIWGFPARHGGTPHSWMVSDGQSIYKWIKYDEMDD